MKHHKVLIKPITESKGKKKGAKTDEKVGHVEMKEKRDRQFKKMGRRRWTKERNRNF